MHKTALLTVCAFFALALSPAALAAPAFVPLPLGPAMAERLDLATEAAPSATEVAAVADPARPEPAPAAARSLPPPAKPRRATIRIAGINFAAPAGRPEVVSAGHRLECVTFARMLSGLELFGDAKTWWAKARGLYDLLAAPRPGAVMVFAGTGRMRRGHVAVVKEVVSAREVKVDHANWGDDGKLYLNMPVVDVSPNNDWSMVKVWNPKLGQLGTHAYPLKGFVAQ